MKDAGIFDGYVSGASLLRLALQNLRGHPRRVLSLVALALGLALLAVGPPLIVARLVDQAINGATTPTIALAAGAGVALLALADSALMYVRRLLLIGAEIATRGEAATSLFRRCVRMSFKGLGSAGEAAVIRSFDDLDAAIEFSASRSIDLVADIVLLASYSLLLFYVEWRLALVFILLSFGSLAHSIFVGKQIQAAADAWLPKRDRRFEWIVECVTSLLTIKSLSAHTYVERPFAQEQRLEERALGDYRRKVALGDAASRFWAIAAPGVGGVCGVIMLLNGELTAGGLVLFLAVSAALVGALASVYQHLQQYYQAFASLARMRDVVSQKIEPLDGAREEFPLSRRSLYVRDVSFTHSGSNDVTLRDVTLHLEPGDHIAIVGRSGEGKTSLAYLLTRLLDPDGGSVDFGGLTDHHLLTYRRRVLFAPHAPSVFRSNVRENVRLWDADVSDEQVWAALEQAELSALVTGLAQGLDTMLGSGGNPLSAGERQRLGLARIHLRTPDVLIMDEATSAMDAQTEAEVLAGIRQKMQAGIFIAITHREAVAATFARVYRMQGGRLRREPAAPG